MTDKTNNLCTKDNPMPKGSMGTWSHAGVECVGENYEGDADYMKCKDCGQEWTIYYD